jgi:hypothetical protein
MAPVSEYFLLCFIRTKSVYSMHMLFVFVLVCAASAQNLWNAIQGDSSLSKFATAIKDTGLVSHMTDSRASYTVLAPVDSGLPPRPSREVLDLHIVNGTPALVFVDSS